jgi:hypothetical protein
MDEQTFEIIERRVRNTARRLPYPNTPDLSRVLTVQQAARRRDRSRIRQRTAWVAASVLVIILLASLATPSVRAAVLEFLQIGVVRIFQVAPAPLPEAPVTATPLPAVTGTPSRSHTPEPAPADLVSILDLEGQTTLEDARAKVSFPIRLPTYPPDLGSPDHVILQDHTGSVLILVWTLPEDPDQARLSLHTIQPGSWTVEKVKPVFVQETTVNGRAAVWAVGPYIVRLVNGDLDVRRLIEGNVLIWTEGGLTYRLETDLPIEEAIRIAESLK